MHPRATPIAIAHGRLRPARPVAGGGTLFCVGGGETSLLARSLNRPV
ncbi:hypothetical protein [Nanchangia anserum]